MTVDNEHISNLRRNLFHKNRILIPLIISLIMFSIFAIPEVILAWIMCNDSNYMNGSVISPFDSIVEEYNPKSLKPCSYPVLENQYNNTFLCDCKLK